MWQWPLRLRSARRGPRCVYFRHRSGFPAPGPARPAPSRSHLFRPPSPPDRPRRPHASASPVTTWARGRAIVCGASRIPCASSGPWARGSTRAAPHPPRRVRPPGLSQKMGPHQSIFPFCHRSLLSVRPVRRSPVPSPTPSSPPPGPRTVPLTPADISRECNNIVTISVFLQKVARAGILRTQFRLDLSRTFKEHLERALSKSSKRVRATVESFASLSSRGGFASSVSAFREYLGFRRCGLRPQRDERSESLQGSSEAKNNPR